MTLLPAVAGGIAPTLLRVAAADAGLRAEFFLAKELPFLSRTRVRQKIQTGESLLNGRRYATSARLREGDEIAVLWRAEPVRAAAPSLPIIFEDDFLVAVDKPAGIASHPAGRIRSGTVVQSVRERFSGEIARSLARGDGGFFPGLANRLDMFTSGVVILAKSSGPLRAMQALAARGGVSKTYAALVEGRMLFEEGRIDFPIGPDEASGISVKMTVRQDGLPAATEYRAIRRLPWHTLLEVRPLSGRQHQIRVHLAAAGHPVWGDLLYKDDRLFRRYLSNGCRLDESLPPRHMLHAERAEFTHPVTGARIEIRAPVPEDFTRVLAGLE